jgi:hypothetical protein
MRHGRDDLNHLMFVTRVVMKPRPLPGSEASAVQAAPQLAAPQVPGAASRLAAPGAMGAASPQAARAP